MIACAHSHVQPSLLLLTLVLCAVHAIHTQCTAMHVLQCRIWEKLANVLCHVNIYVYKHAVWACVGIQVCMYMYVNSCIFAYIYTRSADKHWPANDCEVVHSLFPPLLQLLHLICDWTCIRTMNKIWENHDDMSTVIDADISHITHYWQTSTMRHPSQKSTQGSWLIIRASAMRDTTANALDLVWDDVVSTVYERECSSEALFDCRCHCVTSMQWQ
jgi:hypothetical protein